ncbi:hypothetical protein RYX36_003520, partial [Vicia faba]
SGGPGVHDLGVQVLKPGASFGWRTGFEINETYYTCRFEWKAFLSPPGHTSYMPQAGPSTSIPTIDPGFTQYRDPGGGSSTSHSSPMHSPHEEQGDDDDHAE